MKKLLASTLVLGGVSGGAYATPTTLNLDQIWSPSIGTGTLGTVTLTQNGSDEVDVSVVLAANTEFVGTGNYFAIAFNVNVSGISTVVTGSMVGLMRPLTPNASDPPHGSFGYGLECTGCGPGGSHANRGPLTFEMLDSSGISVSDFVANGTVPNYYFAADVIGPAGGTGSIASKGPQPKCGYAGTCFHGTSRCGHIRYRDASAASPNRLRTSCGRPTRCGPIHRKRMFSEERWRGDHGTSGRRGSSSISPCRYQARLPRTAG